MSKYWTVTLEENEFAEKFPEIFSQNLNKSDKFRLAKAGAKKGNKNAVGNKGRWTKSTE